jgi:hypothetical protein
MKEAVLSSIEDIKMKTLPQITKVVAVVALATNQRGILNEKSRVSSRDLIIDFLEDMAAMFINWRLWGGGGCQFVS